MSREKRRKGIRSVTTAGQRRFLDRLRDLTARFALLPPRFAVFTVRFVVFVFVARLAARDVVAVRCSVVGGGGADLR